MAIRPFEFSKYKAPQFDEGNIQKLTRTSATLVESDDGQNSDENLSDLLGRVSKTSSIEIDNLIGEFEGLRRRLQTDGDRIQREIEEYRVLSQQVMQLTKIISEGVQQFPAVSKTLDN